MTHRDAPEYERDKRWNADIEMSLEPPPQSGQVDLEALMHAVATGQQYVWAPPA